MTRDIRVHLLAIAVGAELRAMRVRAGLSQSELAQRIGSYRPIVGRIERGLHPATLETCWRIADACGGSVLDVARAIDRVYGLPTAQQGSAAA
jgi:transcriptional regulator with XRE-family HTH domain